MVLVNGLDIPVREIGEEMGRKLRRTAKVTSTVTILAAKGFHSTRPYPLLAALTGMTLGIAPFFIAAPAQAKIAMKVAQFPSPW
ncbi:MAG: hypothetical protein HC781_23295 [Leptolyngbyaceae cyanobacterium CSU_1_4]|nr:hypothetical protein [Leptolyngbyaceae cyanobacterium CSU_1_4]